MWNFFINIIIPILGIWGYISDNDIFMIIAIILSIIPFLFKYLEGQKYQIKYLIFFIFIGILLSVIFKFSYLKGITITIVFPNLFISSIMVALIIVVKLFKKPEIG